ncbi:MAG: MGMT family protein [Firmicutes bacterium]|nr:MGMT family protein [Bacillota bacterium]
MFSAFYEIVKSIPKGKVASYGQVASLAGFNGCARQVGYALHNNPDPETIPCHRVVFKDGSLSSAFAFGGIDVHRKLLEDEGVGFIGDKVDMKIFSL